MKKHFRRTLIIFLSAVLVFLLCGCTALDEMRHNQAFFDADGNILWNGSVYKKLPACDYFAPQINYTNTVYVTEADVPVLLSDMLSLSSYSPSDDSMLLEEDNYEERSYYCEASLYEDLRDRILAPFAPDLLCYSYSVYNDDTYDLEIKQYTLTQEQADAIAYVVENTEPTVLQEGMYLECDWSVYLDECSRDMLFRKNTMDISGSGNTYYLYLYTDQETLLFTVPEDCNAVFAHIVKAYLETEAPYIVDEAFTEALDF